MIQAAGLWKLGRFWAELVFVIFTELSSPLLLSDRAPGSFSASAIANSHVSTLLGWLGPALYWIWRPLNRGDN